VTKLLLNIAVLLMVGLLCLGKEKGTGYFVEGFLGRPRGRNVDSRPVVVATYCCHSAEPKG